MSFSGDLPFQNFNHRIFYACQAVLVSSEDDYADISDLYVYKKRGRNRSDEAVTTTDIKESFFLEGVQSVGVNGDFPSQSFLDVGKLGQQYHYYGQQNFEITIERKIDENQEFFYSINPANYITYEKSHILYKENLGDKGLKDDKDNVLREFDITILYTPDRMRHMGSFLDDTVMPTEYNSTSNPYRMPPTGIPAISAEVYEPDADKVMSVTYLGCLLSSIDYDIGLDGVTETVSLFTKRLRYNKDASKLSDYNFSKKSINESFLSDGRNPPPPSGDGLSFSREKFTYMPHSGVAPNSAGNWAVQTLKRNHLDILKQDQDRKSRLPQEVITAFDINSTYNEESTYMADNGTVQPLKMLGITSINVSINIDYTQLSNLGNWSASEKNKQYEQNHYTQVNLPIQVTSSFTGRPRQMFDYSDFVFLGDESDPPVHTPGFNKAIKLLNNDVNFAASGVTDSVSGLSRGGGPYEDGIDHNNKPFPNGTNKTVYNKTDRPIRLVFTSIDMTVGAGTPRYHVIDLGNRNYVSSISTTGGDAGTTSSVETTITYQNDFSDAVLVKNSDVIDLVNGDLF